MTVSVATILTRLGYMLEDPDHDTWTADELVSWINEAQNQIVLWRPDANAVRETVQLAAGALQSLPAGGYQLIELVRNMGDGSTPGRRTRFVDRETLDSFDLDWSSATASTTVQNWVYNPRDPTNYEVYPPQPSSNMGYAEIVYSKPPATVTSGDDLELPDIFVGPVLDWVIYRALSQDGESSNASRAATHYRTCLDALGVKATNQAGTNPAQQAPPNNPAMVGRA